jgi:hypothetical protein
MKKIILTIPPAKDRKIFAPVTKVIPNKKKKAQKNACRYHRPRTLSPKVRR